MEHDQLLRHVRPVPDVVSGIDTDGRLTLQCEARDETFSCGPGGTAMWIALQQHDWHVDATAHALGRIWAMDVLWVRMMLARWLEELMAAGVVEEV
ncbi:PqqD family protein [Streptomyces sp. NPDC091292]|uniref:PqqD family protein n=1 Tax=Streptomyces sp. NPDC091292 TaxID=3365991 RepID=UPI0037FFCA57